MSEIKLPSDTPQPFDNVDLIIERWHDAKSWSDIILATYGIVNRSYEHRFMGQMMATIERLRSAEQSEGSPSPLGSTLDEARAHRRQNPEYVEAENRIAALARKLAETHGCSETDTDEDVDEFFQQHRDEYEGLAVTALSWLAEQAKGRVFEIDDALADVAIEGIYGADRVRDMKADHDFFYTEYADMRRDQKAAIRAVFDKVGLPFTDAPKNEGVANAK